MFLSRARVAVFRYGTRLDRALQRRLTPAGRLVASGTLAGIAFGLDVRQTVSLQIAAMLLGLLCVAALFLFRRSPAMRVRRTIAVSASVGVPLRYTLTLDRLSPAGQAVDIDVTDVLDSPLPDATAMRTVRETPGIDGPLERWIGLRRWLRLVRARRGAHVVESVPASLAGDASVTLPMTIVPLRRGYVHFTATTIACADPLGLINAVADIPSPGSLLVLPRRFRVPRLDLLGARRYQIGGAHRVSRVGDSREFLSLRDYVSGDPRRHIHWRGWAHTGRPIVRQFEDQYLSRQALILDTYVDIPNEVDAPKQAMNWPGLGDDALEAAVSLAASFVVAGHPADSVVDLMFVGARAVHAQAGRGLGAPMRLLELLACAESAPASGFETLTRLVQTQLGQISAAIVILLGWDQPRQALIRRIRAAGIPTVVIVVTSGGEIDSDPGPMRDQPESFCVVAPDHVERDIATLGSPRDRSDRRWRA